MVRRSLPNFEYVIIITYRDIIVIKNVPINVPINLSNNEILILDLIKNNSNITQTELAKRINCTTKTVKRAITKLKEKNILKRAGSNKNGYWKINL